MKKFMIILIIILSFSLILGLINLTNQNMKEKDKSKRIIDNTVENNIVEESEEKMISEIILEVNNKQLKIKLEDNSSAKALAQKLYEGDIVIDAHDFSNFEKVGELGFNLPTNDKQFKTKPGDVILYQGNNFVLYYGTNTWSFTKLGEVVNVNDKELKEILGNGDVIMTLKKIINF